MEKMFCYQCQETAKGTGCTVRGVCGKTSDVANLQDLLLFILKGIAHYRVQLRALDAVDHSADRFILDGLFMTITNANFDKQRFVEKIKEAIKLREQLKQAFLDKGGKPEKITFEGAFWTANTLEEMESKAGFVGVLSTENEDIRSLREMLTYGMKGMAAYTEHAYNLGHENPSIYEFIDRGLVATTLPLSADQLVQMVLECGKNGVDAMALLDKANTDTYGNPEITKVDIGVRKNPGILISGHDLRDLYELLEQTEGTGVDVYTHSEMLPAHYYPETTVTRGGDKCMNSNISTARCYLPRTASFPRIRTQITRTGCTRPDRQVSPGSSISSASPDNRKISVKSSNTLKDARHRRPSKPEVSLEDSPTTKCSHWQTKSWKP